jgi:hypothetical protein
MERLQSRGMRIFSAAIAATGWVAIWLQFYLILVNRIDSIGETIVQFFSFFTILTNILVAVCFSALVAGSGSPGFSFFSQPKVQTAICAYIIFVALIYHALLSHIWDPHGLQLVVDQLLHSLVPAFSVVFWFLFTVKSTLRWKYTLSWLFYPLAYLVYILIRGALTGAYPYPFINVVDLGYFRVLWNSGALMIAFLLLSLLLVALGKAIGRKATHAQ